MGGYILLSKDIENSDIWNKPPMYLKVWMYLLIHAQYSDYGNLKRGQLYTSIPEIQKACSYKVGYRTETPSRKEIWGILEWLRNPHEEDTKGTRRETMIETMKVTHGLAVTICKYNTYQDFKYYEGNSEGNSEGIAKRTRKEQQGNNIKKETINNKLNNNYYSSSGKKGIREPIPGQTLEEKIAAYWGEEK